jgi:uncharacterized membrane protein
MLLRIGVIVAGLVVLVGGVIFLFTEGGDRAAYQSFNGEPVELRTVGLIVAHALKLESRGIIQFGLLLLIALPIARVLFSIFAFLKEKDWTFVVMTALVLSFLLFSLTFKG